ncbi:MAG: helix-turn-helix transcriptional regulator [Clostridia bacterium]|nr:helix-turn-helix transcriptional regulator [Clostridia bacterium]
MKDVIMNYESLGERIRRLRHSMNITQDALAERLGISASFLGHLERGSRKASLDTLVALCNYLNVSPEYLLADSLNAENLAATSKLTPRQHTALNEIYHVIQSTIVDWTAMAQQDKKDSDEAKENENAKAPVETEETEATEEKPEA